MKGILREVVTTILGALLIYALIQILGQTIEVNMSSMEPTLHQGQRMIVSKVSYFFGRPQRGDIVILHPPTNPGDTYIKRVIGLPGDTIRVTGGNVYVNGNPLHEPYIAQPPAYVTEPLKLAEDSYYVMGDNRNSSIDSHVFGPVMRGSIIGKTWLRYYPLSTFGMAPNYGFKTK